MRRTALVCALAALAVMGCIPKDGIEIELAAGLAHPDYDELVAFVKSTGFEEALPAAYERRVEHPPGSLRSSYFRSKTLHRLTCGLEEVTPPKPLVILCVEMYEPGRSRHMSSEATRAVRQLQEVLKQRYGQNAIR